MSLPETTNSTPPAVPPVPQLRRYRGMQYVRVPAESVIVGDRVLCMLSDAVAGVEVTSISPRTTDLGNGIVLRSIRYGFTRAPWWVEEDPCRMSGTPGELVCIVPRAEHLAAIQAAPPVRLVADEDLTETERADITTALREWLGSNWRNPDVNFDGTCELNVAYNQGFPLAAARLIFSSTEAPALAEVFERHRIAIDPDRWADGWSEFRLAFGVQCDGTNGCGAYTYALPSGSVDWLADLAGAVWPTECGGCRAALPVKHFTDTYVTQTSGAWAECTCGWESGDGLTVTAADATAQRHRLHPDEDGE